MSDEERNALWSAADDYNRRLFEFYCGGSVTEEELMADYPTLLNIYGDGMMGHIHIPRLNISIPIMHTTSESVLQNAVGHLETSSLPVGGENTHCVLSGHTGLPNAEMFTKLDKMSVTGAHQGVIASAAAHEYADLDELIRAGVPVRGL